MEIISKSITNKDNYPLITANGFILATGLANPASLVNRITSSTFLYASGASSESTFGVFVCTLIPASSRDFLNLSESICSLAAVLDNLLPAPWQEEEKASFPPFFGPANIQDAVPISPGTRYWLTNT